MKNSLLLFLLFLISTNLPAQTKSELLSTKIGNLDIKSIQKLKNYNLLSALDMHTLSVFIVKLAQQETSIKNLTYAQLLEKFATYKKNQKRQVFKKNNFGNDSIFIRTPYGDKYFIGMGKLSLEKLVLRASKSLPKLYDKEVLNKKIGNTKEATAIIKGLNLNEEDHVFFGNILIILSEHGKEIDRYKIGDFIEITKRIKNSDELKPILRNLKKS